MTDKREDDLTNNSCYRVMYLVKLFRWFKCMPDCRMPHTASRTLK
jgi:hypothetical protein